MNLGVRFHAAARAEFVAAAAWYEAQQPGLGAAFIGEIEHCVERVAEEPALFPLVHGGLRRVVARRFPYCVYFRENADGVFVFAVFHASRDPHAWRRRS